ncbi:MAG TPA: hypothetical protein PKN36_04440 [bacterium]|nr:hypothetical protein [bacterium]
MEERRKRNSSKVRTGSKDDFAPFHAEITIDRKGTAWFASSIPIFNRKKKKSDIFCG